MIELKMCSVELEWVPEADTDQAHKTARGKT